MENISGRIDNFININPWTQFYDLKDRKDVPLSYANNITMKNCEISCIRFFDVKPDENQYKLSDFVFENLKIHAVYDDFDTSAIDGFTVNNVNVK